MERRRLTREEIDKVRKIDGFPEATDQDIMDLSMAPFYTSCPNPFIDDFFNEMGKEYIEETDEYKCEPYSADVSEGKGDVIYNAHSYHTKVPYKAIMRYILHYTMPGDIIFDGFCGTGMTGVAAQMCGSSNDLLRIFFETEDKKIKWGARASILSDLSPAATLVAYNYNFPVSDPIGFKNRWEVIWKRCEEKYSWMYETSPKTVDTCGSLASDRGKINYTIWSDSFICPHCGEEYIYWDVAVDTEKKRIRDVMYCPRCHTELNKKTSERAFTTFFDEGLGRVVRIAKQVPVFIEYSYMGKRYVKKPDSKDLETIKKIEEMHIDTWYPTNRMCEGKEARRNDTAGITHVHHFYTRRNLAVLSYVFTEAKTLKTDERLALMSAIRASMSYGTKMVKVNVGRLLNGGGTFSFGAVTGTLYMPSITAERPILEAISNKVDGIVKIFSDYPKEHNVLISTGSLTNMNHMRNNSVDYIFTDPPFGDNLNYSELNFLWECWGKVITNNNSEAIVDSNKGKGILEYQNLMTDCFKEYYRVLKPNRWITIEFHNSKNAVWNAIQEALSKAGFIVADIRTLDKQQGSFKQTTTTSAVKQDLVISAYKPNNQFKREMLSKAGTEETAWAFVRQYLEKLNVVVMCNEKIEIIAERQAFLLWDRMVAHHVINGISIPIDASDFYKGLDERFLKRDNMYFLPDQVNEYDTARIKNDIEPIQFSLFVTNEKSAIAWLYQQLDDNTGERQTYAQLQPKFMQEVKTVDKFEAIPELSVILEENFLQDEKGRWYIPDVTKEGDLAKLREKNLWKEFEGYLHSKGKLKLFRSEAVRVGFARLWKDKNYAAIVEVAERLPEQTIQEDANLLMYYDISLSRV